MIKDGAFLKTSCGSPNYAGTAFFELLFLELLFLELLFFEFFFWKLLAAHPTMQRHCSFFSVFFQLLCRHLKCFLKRNFLRLTQPCRHCNLFFNCVSFFCGWNTHDKVWVRLGHWEAGKKKSQYSLYKATGEMPFENARLSSFFLALALYRREKIYFLWKIW